MRKVIALGSAALIAAVVLGACGGSSKPASSATTTTAAGGSSSTPGSSSDAFSQLVANADKQKFKITYTSGSSSDTSTSGDSSDTFTYEQDGKGNSVYTSGTTQYFTTATGSVSCDTSATPVTCTEIPSVGGLASNPFLVFVNLGKTYADVLGNAGGDTSNETIAGRDAECVTFSPKNLGGIAGAAAGALGDEASAKYCVDKSTGVLLEISGTDASGKSSSLIEVTKFEEPSDSDFTPPATPKTIPSYSIPSVSLPSGVTIPGGG